MTGHYVNIKQVSFIIYAIYAVFAGGVLFADDLPVVRNIVATSPNSKSIMISWDIPKNAPDIRELLIFRKNKAITSFADIKDTPPLARLSQKTTTYKDNVKDTCDYYYAVVAVVSSGMYNVVIGAINSTVTGVHIKAKTDGQKVATHTARQRDFKKGKNFARTTPLPILDLMGIKRHTPVVMSDESHKIAYELGSDGRNKILPPHIFEEDMVTTGGGDDFLLFEILRTTFIQRKYKEAADSLWQFTNARRTVETTNRACFYLAESYYYSKDYKTAIHYFLRVYDVWPAIVKKRIDSALDLYQING